MSTEEFVQEQSGEPTPLPARPAWECVAGALGLEIGFREVEEDVEDWIDEADGRKVTTDEVVEVLRGHLSPTTPPVLVALRNVACSDIAERFAEGQAQALLHLVRAPADDFDEDLFSYTYMSNFVCGAVKALNQALEVRVLKALTGAKCAD